MPTAKKKKATPKKPVAKKTAPKKAAVKTPAPLFKEVVTKIWDFSRIPVGSIVKGIINRKPFEGRIGLDSRSFYVCQNVTAGANCENKLGYKYSWSIGKGTPEELKDHNVKISDIQLDPTFVIPPVPKKFTINGRIVEFRKGYIQVGCTSVRNTTLREILEQVID